MRSWQLRELHNGVTVWGQGVTELSKQVRNMYHAVARTRKRFNTSAGNVVQVLPPLSVILCSALGLLCQCVDSLKCANPFDTRWIDSSWQDAPCHFVCCHLTGALSLCLPTLSSSTHAWSDIKKEGWVPHKVFTWYWYCSSMEDDMWAGSIKLLLSSTFSEIKVRRCKTYTGLSVQLNGYLLVLVYE